jgi:cell division septation protein DedD
VKFLNLTVLMSAAALCSLPAWSETAFLVQLGSFTNEKAAEARWESLKDDYEDTFESLTHQKNSIILPGMDEERFRLQAGPFVDRLDAQSVCAVLKRDDQGCFVVETAMFTGDSKPASLVKQEVEEVETEVADIDAEELLESAEEVAEPEDETAITVPDIALADNQPVDESSFLDDVTSAIIAPFYSTPDLDEETEEADLENNQEEKVTEDQSAETDSAEENVEIAEIAEPSTPVVLPWLRSDRNRQKLRFESANSENTSINSPVEATPTEIPVVEKPDTEIQAVAEVQAPAIVRTPSLAKPETPRVIVQPLPDSKTPFVSGSQADVEGTSEGVEISEAIAVPVSGASPFDTENAGTVPGNEPVIPVFRKRRSVAPGGLPSSDRILWGQIKSFKDKGTALNYWQSLQQNHPAELGSLRMRLSQPYLQRNSGGTTTLEFGPVAGKEALMQICKLAVTNEKLSCGVNQRAASRKGRYGSRSGKTRYQIKSSNKPIARHSSSSRRNAPFWVQLGSYRSRGDAMQMWNELSEKNKALDGKYPHLARPVNKSTANSLYRLRTGPYVTRIAAKEICDRLARNNVSCLVVQQ